MLNRLGTAIARLSALQSYQSKLYALAMTTGHGTLYGPSSHEIVAYNFGSSVRPDVAPIRVTPYGRETVSSFLARGGQIVKGAPKVAKGATLVTTVRSRTTHVAKSRG